MDLYTLLGVEEKVANTEVKKAYRQKALSPATQTKIQKPQSS